MPGSCVTMTKVWPFSAFSSSMSVMISFGGLGVERAGGLVGPDDRRVVDQGRAMVTRWRWPPESCEGRLCARSARPTRSSAGIACSRACRALTPETTSGSSTFSTAESTGSRL